ncbi:MAG: acyltransferase [Hyphomicrobiales bacterium]
MSKPILLIDYAEPGKNSYGIIRLLAALAVVFSHASIISGGVSIKEPLEVLTGYTLGAHAVHIFFVLSGLMVTASFERSRNIYAFVWARLLRIYPAMMTVVVVFIIIGGLFYTSAAQSDYWSSGNIGGYFLRNMLLLGGGATLLGIFENNPLANAINGPLWTLKFEVVCYISLVITLGLAQKFFPPEKRQKIILIITGMILATTLLLHVTPPAYHDSGHLDHLIRMAFAFYLGSLAWTLRARFVLSVWIVSGLSVLVVLFTHFALPLREQIQIIFLAYGVLWLGHFSGGKLQSFIDKQDYSYGVYIIGFPVQQTLMLYNESMTPTQNFLMAVPITLVLAALSWNLVERPAMKFKKIFNSGLKVGLLGRYRLG